MLESLQIRFGNNVQSRWLFSNTGNACAFEVN